MIWPRLPVRARITAAFAVVMTVLLTGISLAVYTSTGAALLDELDSGLRFRGGAIATASPHGAVETVDPALAEPGEAFDQLVTRSGRVLRSSPGLPSTSILTRAELAAVTRPTFYQRPVRGVAETARLLAIPLRSSGASYVLLVGGSMSDRTDQLRHLRNVLAIGVPLAVVVACGAAWIVAGLALRPMERMRQQASAITVSDLDRRLDLPVVRDELYRLAETLNDLLDRLARARDHDRRFLARASHELRTPLALLKTELGLARDRPRTTDELRGTVRSAAEEVDRLSRLANDLLVLARTAEGRLPVRREPVPLNSIVEPAVASFRGRAADSGHRLSDDRVDGVVDVDPVRVRQALDNLIDNALRHTPAGTSVQVHAGIAEGFLHLDVVDDGPGFVHRPDADRAGLGLEIATTIATSHGGGLCVTRPGGGGAKVSVTFARATSAR